MALTVKHHTQSAVSDDAVSGEVGPSEWNENHDLTGSVAASEVTSGAALTKTDDTNITLTLGGTPTAALLAATSITLGWTSTLAAARLNSQVVQSVVNDTNITASILNQIMTLAWASTLGAARGGTGVANNAASTITISGSFGTTLSVTGTTAVTLPTSGTLATLAGAEELTNKTLNASVGKGAWTASGTWTLPALTLGGTVSGGGQQLNNIIIGTSTPLAGTFTALTSTGNTILGDASGDTVVMNAKSITKPNMVAFLAYNSADDVDVTGDGTAVTVDFDTEITDRGGDFSADTFTAPVTGIYRFMGSLFLLNLTAGTHVAQVELVTSNRTYFVALMVIPTSVSSMAFPFAIEAVDMDAADTAFVRLTVLSGTKIVDVDGAASPTTFFSGTLSG